MKFKGIELKGTYEFRCDTTSFEVYDKKGNEIYCEDSKGFWSKSEYDEKGNRIYIENSEGYWEKSYYENSKGFWERSYFENSNGKIIDKRVKELTIEEIENLLGYKIKIKGERK